MVRGKSANPNLALLERRGALRTLRAFDAKAPAKPHPRIEAQSADDFRKTIVRRVRT
jgi:hypothetical protein